MDRFEISFFSGLEDNEPDVREVTWAQVCRLLTKHERREDKEAGYLWSPCGYEGTRSNANARAVNLAVFDIDEMNLAEVAGTVKRVEANKLAAILYSTHSFTPAQPKCRLVLRLSRAIQPSEFQTARRAIEARLAVKPDKNTKDLARFYFLPSAPVGAEVVADVFEGDPLDVDSLELGPSVSSEARAPARLPEVDGSSPSPTGPAPTNLTEYFLSARRIRDPERRELLLSFLEGRMAPETGNRENALHLCMNLLAVAGKEPLAPVVVESMLQPVIARMDTADKGAEHYMRKAMSSYERGFAFRSKREAALQATRKALAAMNADTDKGEPAPADGDEPDWHANLITKTDKDGDPSGFSPCGANVELILLHDERFKDQLRFNMLTKQIEVVAGVLKSAPEQTLDVALSNWLARSTYAMQVPRQECAAQLLHAAMLRPFNPIRDYLNNLAPWDGVERISRALHTYAHAEGNDRYIEQISRKFFVSAVARALQPGCKVDTMLILHGAQGIGKSRFVKILGEPWSGNSSTDITSRDAIMVMTGNWLVEWAELASMRKGDIEGLKAFLTKQDDQIRLPYARSVQSFPRNTVFVGTTNDDTPLLDRTGSRRFWPVTVHGKIDADGLKRDREQLWAEAVEAFDAGEKWYLEGEMETIAAAEASLYEADDELLPILFQWYSKKKAPRPRFCTLTEAAKGALMMSPDQIDGRITRRIAEALRAMGFTRKRRRDLNGSQLWVYWAPYNLIHSEYTEGTDDAASKPVAEPA